MSELGCACVRGYIEEGSREKAKWRGVDAEWGSCNEERYVIGKKE